MDDLPKTLDYSHSVITDPGAARWRVSLASFSVLTGASSYIIMLFVAMPLAIHLIVNINDGCDVDTDDACFAPTSKSQTILTATLTLLRLMTLLMGTLVGVISDRFGRKPLLVFALSGYALTAVLFVIGWSSRTTAFFLIGGMVLGAASPITPHGIAYVSDVSPPRDLASNMGMLQGFGYFIGLMFGATVSLGIGNATENADGSQEFDKLFYASFGLGFIISTTGILNTLFLLPESLHKDDRIQAIDWKRANPLGFIPIVTRNGYMFFIWLSAFTAWCSTGAAESVTGGWWLRRYLITEVNVFIQYIVLFWVSSAVGAVVVTRLFVSIRGLKLAIHISTFFTIATGVIFCLMPDSQLSYIAVGVAFLGSPLLPLATTLLMGQVSAKEKGAMAGALRSSEALAKIIGIVVIGNSFSAYIEPFTPDSSCVPAGYTSANKANDCECGVQTCPLATGAFDTFLPSECSLGQLSPTFHGVPSKSIEFLGVAETRPAVPQGFIDAGAASRDTSDLQCAGSGLVGNEGFTTEIDRAWCAGAATLQASGLSAQAATGTNFFIGCPGFDAALLGADSAGPLLNLQLCGFPTPTAITNLTLCDEALLNQTLNHTSGVLNYPLVTPPGVMDNAEAVAIFTAAVLGEEETCPQFGTGELNLCAAGPIASFPGLFPFIYMVGLPLIGWILFIIAECFFIAGDGEYWKDSDKRHANVLESEEIKVSDL